MFKLGGFLFSFGILSLILNYFDREFIIFLWINLWGTKAAVGIRVGMIVLGLVLMGIGYSEFEAKTGDGED